MGWRQSNPKFLTKQLEEAAGHAETATESANSASAYATTQGDYAKEQGNYAKVRGDYAQTKGDYADEKAILADQAAGNANNEASNLSQLKIDVVTATQNANTATDSANTATSNANDSATYATEQGDYAKAQGNFAKEQGLFAQNEASNLSQLKADTQTATTNANNAAANANAEASNLSGLKSAVETATAEANTATSNAQTQANHAKTQGDYAKNQGNYAKQQGDIIQDILVQGVVKSVNNTQPDTNGNITIDIPEPDLSGYATKQELQGKANISHTHTIAQVSGLQTEIDNLKSSVSDGKNSVEVAIEGKGGTVADTNNPPSFADLVNGVNSIPQAQNNPVSIGTITPGTATKNYSEGYYNPFSVLGDSDLIASNIRSGKNIFGVNGNLVAGIKYASGSAETDAAYQFQYADGSGSYGTYSVAVSGLDFKPSKVILYNKISNNYEYFTIYIEDTYLPYTKSVKVAGFSPSDYSGVTNRNYKADISPAYVSYGGFRLPVYRIGVYEWIAYA